MNNKRKRKKKEMQICFKDFLGENFWKKSPGVHFAPSTARDMYVLL
jgi:hypothetical protein